MLQNQNLKQLQRHLSNKMTGAEQQPKKQINRLRENIYAEKQKTYLQIDIEADLQWTNAHREVNKK